MMLSRQGSGVRVVLLSAGMLALAIVAIGARHGEEAEAPASIRMPRKTPRSELASRAKVSFDFALQVARTAVAGTVIAAKLEVDDGGLIYSVEIVEPGGTVAEVEVDAGNGVILEIERDDGDDD